MMKLLISFVSLLVCIGILAFAGYKTYTDNRIEEMIAKIEVVIDEGFGNLGNPDNDSDNEKDPAKPDFGGSDNGVIGGDTDIGGGADDGEDLPGGDIDTPDNDDATEPSSPTLSNQDAKDAFSNFYDNSDPAFNDMNKEFFTGMLSGIFNAMSGGSGSGSDTPPVEDDEDISFDDIFTGNFGSSFDPDVDIEDDPENNESSEVEDYVVQIAGTYYDKLQEGIQAHQQAHADATPEEQAAAKEEFVQRESEAFAGVVNIITKADEAEEDEIVQSVDAVLNSTVCLNTVTESIENDESISSSVQESTADMDEATKDEIKAKLDAALEENPENERQYTYLADLFGITLGGN